MELERKIKFAIHLLQSIPLDDGPVEVSYSGGKDSDVILQLTKEAGIPYRAIYKNTTIDPPGTIAHAKEMGAEIISPKKRFFQLVSEKGFPSRFARFCCEYLKEYKVLPRSIQGIRKEESTKRSERYKEPEFCRTYGGGRMFASIFQFLNGQIKILRNLSQTGGLSVHRSIMMKTENSAWSGGLAASDVLS